MTSSLHPHITDELLSAYIDDAVTQEEKAIIEAAIVEDPAIAWRLESFRYTINLLNSLPAIALPRSFVLSELQMTSQSGANVVAQPGRPPVGTRERAWRVNGGLQSVGQNLGQNWRNFWQVGNLFLRNAAAVSLTVFLALAVSNEFIGQTAHPSAQMNTQTSAAMPAAVSNNEQGADTSAAQPTVLAQTSAPFAAQSTAVVEQTATSQTASEAIQASSANEPAPTTTDSLANRPLAAAATNKESSGVSVAAAPLHSQPGPDDPAGGDQGFTPLPTTNNEPAMSAAQAAPQAQLSAPKAASGKIQAAANSPQMKVQAVMQNTTTLTQTTIVTTTIVTTTSVAAYSTQQSAATPTILVPTQTAVLNNQPEAAPKVATSQANDAGMHLSWLSLAELISAGITLILCVLWWRSSDSHYLAGRQQR